MSLKINLWSGPRNISTALMYSFAQRSDTKVVDEPLYAHYLKNTDASKYHPGAEEVLASMPHDGTEIMRRFTNYSEKNVLFLKQMTHHLLEIDLDFLLNMQNVILTRDPVDMLPSFAEQIKFPEMHDVGYRAHLELLEFLNTKGKPPVVIDSRSILENPEKILKKLCDRLSIPFMTEMLSWPCGPREEDGVWAKYWYKNVHQSTSFKPYKQKSVPFPEHLKPLLEKCSPIYDQLKKLAL